MDAHRQTVRKHIYWIICALTRGQSIELFLQFIMIPARHKEVDVEVNASCGQMMTL